MAEEQISMIRIINQAKAGISLIKLSISVMSSVTALTGYSLRLPVVSDSGLLTAAGVFLLTAGSSVMNNYQDRHTDTLMHRTKTRPLPSGSVTPSFAVKQSAVMIAAGAIILIITTKSFLPFSTGILAVILYNGIYTHFRNHIMLSFFSGIFCGMLPPLIGWFSAGGTIPSIQLIYFMVLLGVWQVPHTWIIILRYRNEYKAAGVATVADFFTAGNLKRVLFLWVLFFALLTLSVKVFFNDIDELSVIGLMINAILLVLIFFKVLILNKGREAYASLFHLLNLSMLGITILTIIYPSFN